MTIIYNDSKKDLPIDQLHRLFYLSGWTGSKDTLKSDHMEHFNLPFIHSTLVLSAWDEERLVGAVRVLSDTIIRSVIYDLVIDPQYQSKGIGKELIKRCIDHYPTSEWLVQTEKHISGYYEKIGFKIYKDVVLTMPSVYQSEE